MFMISNQKHTNRLFVALAEDRAKHISIKPRSLVVGLSEAALDAAELG